MGFGSASGFLPQSLKTRILAACLIGMHVPLLGFVGYQAVAGRVEWVDSAVLLIATMVGAGGALYVIHATLSSARQALDEPSSAPGVADEISELLLRVDEAATSVHARLSTLDRAAHRDPLTGLLNRRGFFAETDALFAARAGGAFAILDLDRFKAVNDRFGHPAGDHVLRAFADRLASVCARDAVIARWGGEEFVIYFPGATEASAHATLGQLMGSIADHPIGQPGMPPITFSAGLVAAGSEAVERAAERADAALYAAKRAGRAQVLVGRDLTISRFAI